MEVTAIQNAILAELKEHGPASMAELTETLVQFSSDDIITAVRGLREDRIITLSSGVYRMANEAGMRLPGSALVKKPATSPQPEPKPEAKPEAAEVPAQLPEPLETQLQTLAARLNPRPVSEAMLKKQVLEALAPLLAGDIGEVLLSIRDDLASMEVAA